MPSFLRNLFGSNDSSDNGFSSFFARFFSFLRTSSTDDEPPANDNNNNDDNNDADDGTSNDADDGANNENEPADDGAAAVAALAPNEDILMGTNGRDNLNGRAGRDFLDGNGGNDRLNGGAKRDVVDGGAGNDRMNGGSGGDSLIAGAGRDTVSGGTGNDHLDGGAGRDTLRGGAGNDMMDGGAGRDSMRGGNGNDALLDGAGNDDLRGGQGNDTLLNSYGRDALRGQSGDDALVSFSDAGEPEIAQDTDAAKVNGDEPFRASNDTLIGGDGADTFYFQLNIDAKADIIAQHTDANTGRVNWQGVAGENGNAHDHWVDSIGNDVIRDFDKSEGDQIVIEGHTVVANVEQIDRNNDGQTDYSLITLTSDQGGAGAHDGDALGTIKVYGDEVTADDIPTERGVFYGEDTFEGKMGVYGTTGNDEISDGRGGQTLYGGDGNDVLIAYGDAGEPVPDQDASGLVYEYDSAASPDDLLIGGDGADTFLFMPLINAKQEIIERNRGDNGEIDWTGNGVAGENDNVHDHWVDGVGNDIIFDFSKDDGDQIVIEGHTANISVEQFDSTNDGDNDADYSVITITSNQGANGGAHNGDSLGTITVYGDLVDEGDITVDAGVFHSIEMIDGAAA